MMHTKIKIFLLGALALLVTHLEVNAFCGFYVAKADAQLFNESSQVILVRDGNHTVITMANDYKGAIRDFAMVVPVPEILQESDIRVVNAGIFDKFDAYTAPRLVEYWDQNPCQQWAIGNTVASVRSLSIMNDSAPMEMAEEEVDLGVTIEATYTVGEYDILILSAEESDGLKTWLKQNGYQIPPNAEEVLDPYIRNEMKFFVVKVNIENQANSGFSQLRPLQIQFNSERFMLPIRLGMANAKSYQDLIVYAFTRRGRVETANYRTTKLPTDREIPVFIKEKEMFGDFYKSVYERAWKRENRNSVMLEYAWNVSGSNPVKCDPCNTPPVTFAELSEAGVWWLQNNQWGGYQGELFVTRLHVRYNRKHFPQDLAFINTPNQENFQGRYVVRHAARGTMDCKAGKQYQKDLAMRREKEMSELAALTGWDLSPFQSYLGHVDPVRAEPQPQRTPSLPETEPAIAVEEPDSFSVETIAEVEVESTDSSERDAFLDRARTEAYAATPQMDRTWILFLVGGLVLGISLFFRRRNADKT